LLKDIKNTVKQSAVYGLSRVAAKLVSFVLLPVYSLNFSVAEYGVISRIETFWQILFALCLFGIESGVVRWYSKIEGNEQKKKFLFSVTMFLIVVNLFFTFLFFFGSGLFSDLIFETSQYSNLIFYASLIATMEAFAFIFFLLLRINEKAFLYTFLSILTAVLNMSIQLYYILYTDNKLNGVFIAKIISPALVVILLIPYYSKFIKAGLDLKNLKELIIFSLPVMFASLAGTLLNQSDRFILGYLGNSTQVGLYSLAYNICGLLNFMVIAPFGLAFTVLSWKKLGDDNAKRFFTKNITYLFFTVAYLALILSLSIPNLIKIFTLNDNYWYAKDIVPWISIAMPFYGISIIGFFSFYVSKKTYYILYIMLISLAINITLNIVLIPFFNMYGAAISNFISFLSLCFITYRFSRKNYFFEYEWTKLFTIVIVFAAIVFPFYYFNLNEFTILNFSLKLISVILFPLILYFFKFYEPQEVESIKGFVNKYFLKKS
jgi:O-antigen/teichoic acid export membrane protein